MSKTKNWKYEIHIRDNFTCLHCGKKEDPNNPTFQIHHLIFKCLGGSNDPSNLILVCPECHKYHFHGLGYPQPRNKRRTKKKKK